MVKYYNYYEYNLTETKDILLNIDKDFNYKLNIKLIILKKIWGEVVGEHLQKFTYPNNLYKGTLYVTCLHQGFIQDLHFKKDMIYSKLQEKFKLYKIKLEINDIRFVPPRKK